MLSNLVSFGRSYIADTVASVQLTMIDFPTFCLGACIGLEVIDALG